MWEPRYGRSQQFKNGAFLKEKKYYRFTSPLPFDNVNIN